MRRRLVKERSALQHDRPAFQDDLIHLVSLHADWLGELFAADRVSASGFPSTLALESRSPPLWA